MSACIHVERYRLGTCACFREGSCIGNGRFFPWQKISRTVRLRYSRCMFSSLYRETEGKKMHSCQQRCTFLKCCTLWMLIWKAVLHILWFPPKFTFPHPQSLSDLLAFCLHTHPARWKRLALEWLSYSLQRLSMGESTRFSWEAVSYVCI